MKTKSESNIVTKAPYLTVYTFLGVVVKRNFHYYLHYYLFSVVMGNRYLPRGSNENALCITTTEIVFVTR